MPSAASYRDAFMAFYPLYEMARLRYLNLEEARNPQRSEVNRLRHNRRLMNHTDVVVSAPNNDTLYSSARLDLRFGPLVVSTPAIRGRYYSLHFMNAYTDNVAILGRRNAGDGPVTVAVVGPGWRGPVPAHTHRVDSDTNDMWLIVRTLVDGPDDVAAVAALQDAMRVEAPRPAADYPHQRVAPAREPTPELFVAVVNEMLERNPPVGAMAEHARAGRVVGLAADGSGGWGRLPAPAREGWAAAWPALRAELLDPAIFQGRRVGAWEFPQDAAGGRTQDLRVRAAVALRAVAGLGVDEALYLWSFNDQDGAPLTGASRYRLRIVPGNLPVAGFWSVTLHEMLPDGRYFLAANPIFRYSIGNRTRGLKANPDGSIDVVLQHAPPQDTSNWLPAPPGAFRLSLRAYLPAPELVQGRLPLPRIDRQP
ncbi:MAG: DUF1254 domain-containing protein [Burkholderiaceae bacterium]